jgi:lysozyme family protein
MLSINIGPARTHSILQEALYELGHALKVDGVLGPLTCTATNYTYSNGLLLELQKKAEKYYRSLNKPEFLEGWLNRLYS